MKRKNNFRNKDTRIKVFKFLIPIASFVLMVFLIWQGFGLLKLRDIECSSQYGDCNKILQNKFDSLEGKPYLKAISQMKNIANDDASIEKYSLQYKPLGIKVNILERQPSFAIAKSNSELKALIHGNGMVLGFTEVTQLPTVIFDNIQLSEGNKIPDKGLFALELMRLVNLSYPTVNTGIIDGESLSVELPKGMRVIFPLEGDTEVLMGSLVLIYSDLENQKGSKINTEGKIIGTIDLRFKNPVLN